MNLTYQQVGYAGTNVVHDPAAITSVAESFNKANGALGPDLGWTREVFTHSFPFQVNANQCRISANSPGTYEDIAVPNPMVDTPNVTYTINITAFARTGTGSFVADTGGIIRYQSRDAATNYRGYAFAFGRSNQFIPGVDRWHFIVIKINGVGEAHPVVPGAAAFAQPADVVLPGTLTFTAEGPDMSGIFTHAGPGPALSISLHDDSYTDGIAVLGGSVGVEGTDTASIDSDVLSITGDDATAVPDPRGFLWVKNSDVSSKTVAVTVPGFTKALAHPDVNVTIPAGGQRLIGPLVPELAIVAGGRPLVAVNYSPNVTGVTAAAVRV